MRFRITLSIDLQNKRDNILPINYQYELSSWIYRTIGRSNSDFADWLHDNGYTRENRKFKLFTFSYLKPGKSKISGDRMIIESENTELIVSFYLPDAVEHFIMGLFRDQHFRLGDRVSSVEFDVRQIEKLPEIMFGNTMKLRTISPLVISYKAEVNQKYAKYLSPDEANYGELLANNLVNKYITLAENGIITNGNTEALQEAQVLVSDLRELRQKLITIKAGKESETRLKGFLFSFVLSAPAELMRIGYYGGFGEKNSLGFGCCEVVDNNLPCLESL